MSVLVLVEHDGSNIKDATLATVTAAAKLGDVNALVIGNNADGVAQAAAKIAGVVKVYVANAPGLEHQLVLLWKGFPPAAALETYRGLAPQGAREIELDDTGRDVHAFLTAARSLEHERIEASRRELRRRVRELVDVVGS